MNGQIDCLLPYMKVMQKQLVLGNELLVYRMIEFGLGEMITFGQWEMDLDLADFVQKSTMIWEGLSMENSRIVFFCPSFCFVTFRLSFENQYVFIFFSKK